MPDTTIGQKLPQFSKLFRLALLIGLIVAAILPALAGAQVPSEVLLRVYYIGVRKGPNAVESGTAFTIDRNGTQYLITAQHVVTGFSKDNPLLVYRNTDWHKLNVKQLRCCQDSDTDLAIFQPKVPLPAAPGELEPDDRSP
ncbi:MAG TPA: hypothetical protein VJ756_12865, partial [Terriglobales bacterium]|nr:hypothetical protein [Terriglobales bacterium]